MLISGLLDADNHLICPLPLFSLDGGRLLHLLLGAPEGIAQNLGTEPSIVCTRYKVDGGIAASQLTSSSSCVNQYPLSHQLHFPGTRVAEPQLHILLNHSLVHEMQIP